MQPIDPKTCPIVYVSPYFDPAVPSGANRRFNELCERFVEEFGDRFHLIVTKGKKPSWWKDGAAHLVEVEYHFNHLSKFSAAAEIGRYLDTLPPSIVIMESLPIPFRALKRHRQFQVAYDFRYFRGESKSFLYRLFFSQYLKYEWKSSEYMVTCSEFSIDELAKYVNYPRERVVKSYFGIDERIFDLPKATEKKWDLIYVGHFEKRKNHEPLLRAIAKVDPALRVLLIGVDNGLKGRLEALAEELKLSNTTFTTLNNDQELWKRYSESRVFAYPSVYEGFGIPLIEALALGIPVVASDISVFHEVGGDLVSFFDPYNPDDIAEKLRAALMNPTPPDPARVQKHLEQFFWKNIYTKFVEDLFARI